MKKLFMTLATLAILAMTVPAIAADISVNIVIPSAYVPRLVAMVNEKYRPGVVGTECEGLTVKQCFIRHMIVKPIKQELYKYELRKARQDALETADEGISQIEVTGE